MVNNGQHPAPELMSQADYARHRKVNRSYITRLAKRGILVMRGKLVDVAGSDAVLDDKPVDVEPHEPPSAQPPRPASDSAGGQTGSSFAQARTAEMVYRARLRKLEFETRQGKLIEAAIVKDRWAAILVVLKERILAVPDKLSPEVAALADERQVRDVLKREMHALLQAVHADIQYAR
jgi:hypothetical protein